MSPFHLGVIIGLFFGAFIGSGALLALGEAIRRGKKA